MTLTRHAGRCLILGFSAAVAVADDALPRWRVGGTPYDPTQPQSPYALCLGGTTDFPRTGVVASPPEYAPVRGVLFRYYRAQWPDVVSDCVTALTKPAEHDEIAYVVVASNTERNDAENRFEADGADLSKVVFIEHPGNALWIRDYGPHFIWQDGALGIVDSHYYPERPLDNFIPTLVGRDSLGLRTYDMGLYYSGGNFQPGPDRQGFVTALIRTDNPASEGFTDEYFSEHFHRFQGIDTLHIMPQLPPGVDSTGHIDMWLYLIDDHTCIISKFKSGSNSEAIKITEDAVPYMENLGFTVFRTPAWNASGAHYTYTNAFRVNNRILVPTYGDGNQSYKDEDAESLSTWQHAAGDDVEIIPINSFSIIPAGGAIHCIVKQVPRHDSPAPSVHVVRPSGGELCLSGSTEAIEWMATDENNVDIPQIDLHYSLDDGANWVFIATTTNTGAYAWTPPKTFSRAARIRVTAVASDFDTGKGISAAPFDIAPGRAKTFDFKTGGGEDKFGYGSAVSNWSGVDAKRHPVTREVKSITQNAYERLANDDATGGDSDSKRFISQSPSSNRSTHTFEFSVPDDPSRIDDLRVQWVGYADTCAQAEIYLWDDVQGNWGDGNASHGQNRFMDSFAGNRDGILDGRMRGPVDRFVNDAGLITLLVFAQRAGNRTFHDYVTVRVSEIRSVADMNCDAIVDFTDIDPFVTSLTDRVAYESAFPDCRYFNADVNDDGSVDFNDIDPFVACLIDGCE